MPTAVRRETRRTPAGENDVATSVLIFSAMAVLVPLLLMHLLRAVGVGAERDFVPWTPLFAATAALTRGFGLLILGVVAVASAAAGVGAVRLGLEGERRPIATALTYASGFLVAAGGWVYLLLIR